MAKKKNIQQQVRDINAENLHTVQNLSQEESKTLADKIGIKVQDANVGNINNKVIDEDVNHDKNANADTSILGNYIEQQGITNSDASDNNQVDWNEEFKNQLKTDYAGKVVQDGKIIPESKKAKISKGIAQYKKEKKDGLEEPNKKFDTFKYDNSEYTPLKLKYSYTDSKDAGKLREEADSKIRINQGQFEKGMEHFADYVRYNQYGGSYNYDQLQSSMTKDEIIASAKALGVGGLARTGIMTKDLYDKMYLAYEGKRKVAQKEYDDIRAKQREAEENLKNKIKDDKLRNELKEYIYNWSQKLSSDPKDFQAEQANFIKGLQQKLADAGYEIKVDGLAEQQTFRRTIEALCENYPELENLFVASGVMMPEGYGEQSDVESFLKGNERGKADYELRFAQRRDQRNRFAQSMLDLAGITSKLLAARGGAKVEPYKNDMYDKFREDMKVARSRYDERIRDIENKKIAAEKEAFNRIRDKEKTELEQQRWIKQFKLQEDAQRINEALQETNIEKAKAEIANIRNNKYYTYKDREEIVSLLKVYNPKDVEKIQKFLNGEDVNLDDITMAESVVRHISDDNNNTVPYEIPEKNKNN